VFVRGGAIGGSAADPAGPSALAVEAESERLRAVRARAEAERRARDEAAAKLAALAAPASAAPSLSGQKRRRELDTFLEELKAKQGACRGRGLAAARQRVH
jgi:hypothetical protein